MSCSLISRPPVAQRDYDVIVLGGGINGVAIARECARAGSRVLLLEANDFGSGTSSRSTRIIHGGLRYLEHGEIGLVRESLRERERLLRERAHLVRPMQFLLALPRRGGLFSLRNSFSIKAGLWLYGAMSEGRWSAGRAAGMHAEAAAGRSAPSECEREFDRQLDDDGRWMVFDYEDGQCEFPERLIAEWMWEAAAAGATTLNHTEVLEIAVKDGRACGVRARDMITGAESRYSARNIVNATGPWVDRVCSASRLKGKRLIGGIRGSHILLDRFTGVSDCAVMTEGADHRPVFVLPWNGQLLVGTTEVADDGDPARCRPDRNETAYLLRAVQQLYPHAGITMANVRACYAGVRPLPYSPGKEAGRITREHILHDHSDDGAAGMLSVIGGKLTTAASLARQCARKLGLDVPEPPLPIIAKGSASGLESTLRQWSRQIGGIAQQKNKMISCGSARAIAEWHGPRALSIIFSATQDERLAQRLCPHSEHLVAEAVHAIRAERAVTFGDILLRRVPVALSGCWSAACSQVAGERIGAALDMNPLAIARGVEKFEEERGVFLRRPAETASGAGGDPVLAERIA